MKTSFDSDFGFQHIWDDYRPSRLIALPALASAINVKHVFAKLEGDRPLGNFKVLGGVTAGLRALARAMGASTLQELRTPQGGRQALPQLICASDGNHGLAVAFAAAHVGTRASIYLPVGVSQARFERIAALGAHIVSIQGTYDDAVSAAQAAAMRGEGILVPDTTDDLDDVVVRDVMSGYSLLTSELIDQFVESGDVRPSHAFIQAGVGGLAAAIAEGFHTHMHHPQRLIVVEPMAAAGVSLALAAGRPVAVGGDLHTCAEMLSCGLASAPAVDMLLRHDARSVVVSDDDIAAAVNALAEFGGPETTPSGAAGLAGLLCVAANEALRAAHLINADSNILLVITEASLGT